MENNSSPRIATKVVLVLELVSGKIGDEECVQLLASRAGAESVRTWTWLCQRGMLDSSQLSDLCAVVDDAVTEAIVTRIGVQELLM